MEMIKSLELYELLIFIAIGLAILFFGYRIKKIAFFIIWFLLGFTLMTYFMPTINNLVPDIANNDIYQFLLPIAGGVLLAMLGFTIEKLCVGGICFVLVMMTTIQYFGTEMSTLAIGAVIGIVMAGAAVALMKPAIIIATAVAGSYALTLAIFAFVTSLSFETYYWPVLIGIAAIGAGVQFLTTKHVS
ncbi:DUF4203 domain-containing protein [Candidatus Saccharibacteria bacterium]|nr:DUF4203 domain-containing protein [Candidatus Saccharibacteria bacterium]